MDTSLWLVIGVLAALLAAGTAAVLLVRVFRARRLLVDAGIPLRDKALVWGAVIYTISPVDLLPDPVYLDDIGVLLVALRSLHAAARAAGAGVRGARGGAGTGTRGAVTREAGEKAESGGNLSVPGSD